MLFLQGLQHGLRWKMSPTKNFLWKNFFVEIRFFDPKRCFLNIKIILRKKKFSWDLKFFHPFSLGQEPCWRWCNSRKIVPSPLFYMHSWNISYRKLKTPINTNLGLQVLFLHSLKVGPKWSNVEKWKNAITQPKMKKKMKFFQQIWDPNHLTHPPNAFPAVFHATRKNFVFYNYFFFEYRSHILLKKIFLSAQSEQIQRDIVIPAFLSTYGCF